jgi:hypothetical protein
MAGIAQEGKAITENATDDLGYHDNQHEADRNFQRPADDSIRRLYMIVH